ncbi:MAG: rhomboid family intramembrane serine protease [Oscillatoriaceae bacterium SKW80]|nr:rhomboid family intramembrane serine protease [Oscillatoriaceae bacterium SKYG93]MCX8121273.1 rhomboid family intramembrane serine protease [Oscillatoriaceae bacterium SKW80]MDW8453393.1 rhomboid family intramembrane serine protease [Oscillatoriaceae cyanobacterium SKYGB_i_bin93]HIK26748.1 rhomboid family intramembrane serine protease [Oscillatoriaceae cyanobacterium M7585_C2015_266]
MVPLRDNNPTRITPYVTYGLIFVNIIIFLYQMSLQPWQIEQFFRIWAVVPRELTASLQGQAVASPFPEWMTLITSQFLHGSILHVAGNMLFLWIFGNNVEDCLGHIKYIIFYITCGVLAALTHWYFSPYSAIPSLGASGAIAGVMGAYILRFPNAEIITLIPLGFFSTIARIPAFFFLGFWFIQQAFNGVASLGIADIGMTGGIAYWAHAGGFVFGAILAPIMGIFDEPTG